LTTTQFYKDQNAALLPAPFFLACRAAHHLRANLVFASKGSGRKVPILRPVAGLEQPNSQAGITPFQSRSPLVDNWPENAKNP